MTPRLAGGGVNVAVMTFSRSTVAGRPERGRSVNPSGPDSRNRLHHNVGVGSEIDNLSAIAVIETPSAAHSTIRARVTNPTGIDGVRSHDSNNARSASEIRPGSARTPQVSHDTYRQ